MIIQNLLYIYQLEHYDKKRFLVFAYTHLNWFGLRKRATLDWTHRVGLIFSVSLVLILLPAMIVYFLAGGWSMVVVFVCGVALLPVLLVLADIVIAPLVLAKKNNSMLLAKQVIREGKRDKLLTVGITGSFGKTSLKHILLSILKEKYTVFSFPGNINTDIGVATYILEHREAVLKADVLVVEMGAYRKGDIKKMCSVVAPDYSLTTAIGECHLERFGSFMNIVSTKFELANATKKKAFLNMDNANIKQYAPTKVGTAIETVPVSSSEQITAVQSLDDFAGLSFTYQGETYTTKLVGGYVTDLAALAFAFAQELGMSAAEIQRGFEKVDYMPHRLQIMRNEAENRIVIDDSYNGNYEGFLAGLTVLERAKGRKVVLTPGIVELGPERSEQVHRALAEYYATKVDLLLLVKNKNTEYIVRVLRKMGYNTFKMYDTAQDAHSDLAHVLKDGDTILFQNDISDNYI
ncbi:MAG: Mur ligase family protein [Candidatus Kaiserbacteria bacterium]|nr:Mur ligase family protein [Candidatus Kaiserbacteria bacterium]